MAKSWVKRRVKAGARRLRKHLWARHKKNAKRRKKVRQQRRTDRQTVATTKNDGQLPARGTFLGRHPLVADVRDWAAVRAHGVLDRRDLRGGMITEEEMEALDGYESQEEWRLDMLARRREELRRQAARNRDTDNGPLVMVYATHHKPTAQIRHVGFRPPTARPAPNLKPSKSTPSWSPPNRRPVRRRRKDHVEHLVDNWKPQLTQNARKAMAADVDLSAAVQSLHNFAEQFPETRSQIHESLGKLAEFGKSYSASMETYRATMSAGKNEDNPGLPPEVLAHLAPLDEVGEIIERASQATLAAWEDYFAPAIKAAQDEHTPSKAALTS